jgi:hypothetical protein
MPDPIETLLDEEADKQAEIDEVTQDGQNQFRSRYAELLNDVDERDPDLWALYVADITVTEQDYMLVPPLDRDHEWSNGFSAMLAAVFQQAWLEIHGLGFIEIAEKNGQKIDRQVNQMTRSQLKEAAIKGVRKQRFQDARDRRQSAR